MTPMKHITTDGGRKAAGFRGKNAADCVCRSIAIASKRPYHEVYARLAQGNAAQRKAPGKRPHRSHGKATACDGIVVQRKWFKDYMAELGFVWTSTMGIGTGCKVHLREGELPMKGRLVVAVSRHYTAVIDGVMHDTHNPSRGGRRCVYGYWKLERRKA